MPAHEVLLLFLVLVPETLGLVLEEGGSAVAVAALHRVLDRFLQAWLVLRRAGGGWRGGEGAWDPLEVSSRACWKMRNDEPTKQKNMKY